MLTLLIFAPCEKVIIGRDDTASIISVLDTVQVGTAGELPANAMMPFRWSIFYLFKREEAVQNPVDFELRTEIFRDDGTRAAGATNEFKVTSDHGMYRLIVNLPVFPIGQPGAVRVKGQIRQVNPETEWRDVGEFPLLVSHEPASEPPTDAVPIVETPTE